MPGCLVGRLAHVLNSLTGGLTNVLDSLIGGLANLLACLRCRLVRASAGKAAERLLRHVAHLRGAADHAAAFTIVVIVRRP
jgi:hypothetical protein